MTFVPSLSIDIHSKPKSLFLELCDAIRTQEIQSTDEQWIFCYLPLWNNASAGLNNAQVNKINKINQLLLAFTVNTEQTAVCC